MNKLSLKQALFIMAALPVSAMAQGTNDGLGGGDVDIKSLYELVTKHEQKSKALNIYINYGTSYQTTRDSREGEWTSRLYNRDLRLEMVGWLTDNIYYRFRHRLTKSNTAESEDNFAKATDYMMVGWKFNDHWSIQGGKKCQALGSFEFDENTLFVYQFSDIEDCIESSKAAINLVYDATPDQQFSAEISNTYTGKLKDEFGENAKVTTGKVTSSSDDETTTVDTQLLEKANHPLSYTAGWNGKFFGGKLQTRWSYTLRTLAKHKYSRMVRLGQKLNLDHLHWYIDYNMTYDDLDRMRIASKETVSVMAPQETNLYAGKVRYQGLVTKLEVDLAPDWKFEAKGMYETASMTQSEQYKNYRKALGYVGTLEYYPARKQQQNLRFFLSYTRRKYDYSKRSMLSDYHTDRIELGMLYRMKLL